MKNKTIDYLNTCLLIISFIIAMYVPFELFLFSYAIFGPLHYLTEINWLNDKKYFIKSKTQWYIIYVVFAIIIAMYPIMVFLDLKLTGTSKAIVDFIISKSNLLLLAGFLFAISLIIFVKTKHLILSLTACIIIAIILSLYIPDVLIGIGIFLPTLFHVYVFTLLFMIYGQYKSKTKPGLLNIILLLIIPILIVGLEIKPNSIELSEFTKSTYSNSNFLILNTRIAQLLGYVEKGNFYVLSPIGVKIQIFIAFAYTYHYLNWFSKTSVIGWKESISTRKLKIILALWVCAISIYFYDYKTGLITLLVLSFLHVFLEFPLNIVTFKSLFYINAKK